MQQAAAAAVIGFQHQVAERLEVEHVLQEESIRAGRVGFPLAGAPQMLGAEAMGERRRRRAGEQTFGRAEIVAALAGVDDAQAGFERGGERLRVLVAGRCRPAD